MDSSRVTQLSQKYPKESVKYAYGTAGFRTKAELLPSVMFRMGCLAALRSKKKSAVIGIMITASHNPVQDNGVKLVDPLGEMLEASWEAHATLLANCRDEEVAVTLQQIATSADVDMQKEAEVYVARDTRPSGEGLCQAVLDGVTALGGCPKDYGILSTPQLHYMIRCRNSQGAYGQDTEDGYFLKFATAYKQLVTSGRKAGHHAACVSVDGANGVGAAKARDMAKHLSDHLEITVSNDGSSGQLNDQCGADYVKVQQTSPHGLEYSPGDRCASFDGDADRIVYFYRTADGQFHLVDGDKIAALIAEFVGEKLTQAGLKLDLGVVQTAYANGSSTNYLQSKGIPVACTCTGVKHLHHKALDFDIGVYFEANGHGTVLFSSHAEELIDKAATEKSSPDDQLAAAQQLSYLKDLINQAVGDALSDMLVVEAILYLRQWSIEQWDSCYTDLPNRQLKVKVADRTVIQTTDAERRVVQPAELQPAIDSTVAKYKGGRSFVRPSGTEDVVRVYAEADDRELADHLAGTVACLVYDLAGGSGDRPLSPAPIDRKRKHEE